MELKDYINPFNYSKYNFITENSIDIKDAWIEYAEKNVNRPEKQIILSNLLNDINLAIKIELSIFEYSLIYCQNNKYNKNFIKPVYEDKFYSIISNIKETPGIDNKTFKNKLLDNTLNPFYVGFLSPSQINPDKWQYIVKKKNM